jgi:hypothetical protein
MQNSNNPPKEDYAKKLSESEQAKLKAEADSYNSAVKFVKWLGVGAFVLVLGSLLLIFLIGTRAHA